MRRRSPVPVVLTAALAGLAGMALVLASPAAQASPGQVAPGQAFTGRVNGSFSHATVQVICPGPAGGGRRGHPVSGQQLEVLSPLPPVAAGIQVSVGQTGTRGRAIVARFQEDPVAAATFRHYFVNQPIPTSLWLPCQGTGTVVFRPTPTGRGAQSSVVTVTYVNLAVTPMPVRRS